MSPEALELIQRLPREEWGLGFIVMTRCLKHFDTNLGELSHYFKHAMSLERITQLRRFGPVRYTRSKTRSRVTTGALVNYDPPAPQPNHEPIPELDPSMTCLDLYARGLSQRQIAAVCDLPPGTVKSRIWTAREILRAKRQRHQTPSLGGGCISGVPTAKNVQLQKGHV